MAAFARTYAISDKHHTLVHIYILPVKNSLLRCHHWGVWQSSLKMATMSQSNLLGLYKFKPLVLNCCMCNLYNLQFCVLELSVCTHVLPIYKKVRHFALRLVCTLAIWRVLTRCLQKLSLSLLRYPNQFKRTG